MAAKFTSSNDLMGRVWMTSGGILTVRLWRGDTELVIKSQTGTGNELEFNTVLNEEVPEPVVTLAADEQAAALLSDEEKTAIHNAAGREAGRWQDVTKEQLQEFVAGAKPEPEGKTAKKVSK